MPATIARGKTFSTNEQVTNTKLHQLVDSATITDIDQTNMASGVGVIIRSTTAPSDTDALWMDTSGSPARLKVYGGSAWIEIPTIASPANNNIPIHNGTNWVAGAASSLGRNALINGNFNVWQRGTSFAAIANGAYHADRWLFGNSSAAVLTVSRDTDVPAVASTNVLQAYSLKLDVTTADAAVAAGDYVTFSQRIEGFNWQTFAQKALVLTFWVKSTTTGTFAVALRNSGPDRSIVSVYTIDQANTWEKKTVTFVASPSAGTWDYTTSWGAELIFTLMAGSTYQTTADTWQVGDYKTTSAQSNGMASNSNDFFFSQIQLEVGSAATSFAFRPYTQELLLCQRYYYKTFPQATAPAQNAGTTGAIGYRCSAAGAVTQGVRVYYPVAMRVGAATWTFYNPSAANAKWRNANDAADSGVAAAERSDENGVNIQNAQVAGDGVGEYIELHLTTDAEL